jgi:hypothetical protein
LAALEAVRRDRDRRSLIALGAVIEIEEIDAAARIGLAVPTVARLPLRERVAAEAVFAVPRAAALERLADAEAALALAGARLAELRATVMGEGNDGAPGRDAGRGDAGAGCHLPRRRHRHDRRGEKPLPREPLYR